jgi:beta-N-acetylglucosaminidase
VIKMKKWMTIFIAFSLVLLLTACNNKEQVIEDEPKDEIEDETPVVEVDDLTKRYKVAIAKNDSTYEIFASFDKFSDAKDNAMTHESDDTIVLYQEDIIYAKYGLIKVDTKNITENTIFSSNGVKNYTNGQYGRDALFIDTQNLAFKIMISGGVGWLNYDEVKLIPAAWVKSPSYYYVNGFGEIVHALSNGVEKSAGVTHTSALDLAPSYLEQGVHYYSYDGHYFYTDYKDHILDQREGTTKRAVNPDTPFYAYYQFLPIRALSGYTTEELNRYLDMTLVGQRENSILINSGQDFINVQEIFKINATMELAWGLHESGFGTSRIARDKNNIFGMNATDSNPYGNATGFETLQDGISYHAHYYVSNKYLNYMADVYNGGALGNKGAGFNVSYASDPYWGEKIASIYYRIDKYLGKRDYNQYQIGITTKPVYVYTEATDTIPTLYLETARKDMSRSGQPFLIIGEEDEFYKVMLNSPLIDGYMDAFKVFDYHDGSVGYVKKDSIYLANTLTK